MKEWKSPDEVLLDFVERLPTTIKDMVLARCCMAFGRLQPVAKQDLAATFRAILTAQDGQPRAYLCAQMSAVLELTLDTPGVMLPDEWHDASNSQRVDNITLLAPLTQKHWQAAEDEFRGLRQRELHTEAFQRLLMQELKSGVMPSTGQGDS